MHRPIVLVSLIHRMQPLLASQKFSLNIVRSVGGPGKDSDSLPFKSIGKAKEAQFFYKKEKELLKKLREDMSEQIKFHEEQIELHRDVIEKLKQKQKEIKD